MTPSLQPTPDLPESQVLEANRSTPPAPQSPSLGLLELGSNSLKLHRYSPTLALCEPSRIEWEVAFEIYSSRKLSEPTIQEIVGHVRTLLETDPPESDDGSEIGGVDDVFGVATGALKQAENRDDLFQRLNQELSVPIRLLKGWEEAQLLTDAFEERVAKRPAMLFDLGGGRLEMVFLGRNRKNYLHETLRLGVIRLHQLGSFNSPKWDEASAVRFIRGELNTKLRVESREVYGTGGAVKAIAQVADTNQLTVDLLENLERETRRSGPPDFLGRQRQSTFLPGLIVVRHILEHVSGEVLYHERVGLGEALMRRLRPYYKSARRKTKARLHGRRAQAVHKSRAWSVSSWGRREIVMNRLVTLFGMSTIFALSASPFPPSLEAGDPQPRFDLGFEFYSNLKIDVLDVAPAFPPDGPRDYEMFVDFDSADNEPFDCGGTIHRRAGDKVRLWGLQTLSVDAPDGDVQGWTIGFVGSGGEIRFIDVAEDVNTEGVIPEGTEIAGYPALKLFGPIQILYDLPAASDLVGQTVFFHSPLVLDPSFQNPNLPSGRRGIVDGAALDVQQMAALPPGTSRLLLFRLEMTVPSEPETVVIENFDGLGFGEPIINSVTFDGGDGVVVVDVTRLGRCELTLVPASGQIPGDADLNGRLSVSDAVKHLRVIFLGEDLPCLTIDASLLLLDFDGNGDAGILDAVTGIGDALDLLGYLFDGGSPHILGVECLPIEDCPETCDL